MHFSLSNYVVRDAQTSVRHPRMEVRQSLRDASSIGKADNLRFPRGKSVDPEFHSLHVSVVKANKRSGEFAPKHVNQNASDKEERKKK